MYRILLCCAAGMSTSLLVTKMEKAAAAKGIEAKIWAVPESQVADQLPVDIVMLGPQIRFAKKKITAVVDPIPVVDIEMRAYGRMDGETVLNEALKVIEK